MNTKVKVISVASLISLSLIYVAYFLRIVMQCYEGLAEMRHFAFGTVIYRTDTWLAYKLAYWIYEQFSSDPISGWIWIVSPVNCMAFIFIPMIIILMGLFIISNWKEWED